MIFRPILVLFLILLSIPVVSQNVVITGQAKDYAGKKLFFYTYAEPISHEATTLAEAIVEPTGIFKFAFQISQTTEIYTDLEKFKGTLVVAPGKNYQIALPPFTPRTRREALSPYFQPELYWLSIKNSDPRELNFLVRSFVTDYNKEVATHVKELYQGKSQDTLKAILARLDRNYPADQNSYLDILKKYSFGDIEMTAAQNHTAPIAEKYFARSEPAISNPAYQRLFNSLFTNYLTIQSQDLRQKKVWESAYRGNFNELVNLLISKHFNRETAELIAVKSFYDGYFSGKFDKQWMLNGLKEAESATTFEPLKSCLPAILIKINSLKEGKKIPQLSLRDVAGHSTGLRTAGKFLYLLFFKSDSKESRQEMDTLVQIHNKLATVLNVLPVSLDADPTASLKLWQEKKYPWQLTFPANPTKVLADFRIKNVPEFYLISPDQIVLLAPALPPTHNFESLFLKIFRESKFRQGGK